MKHKQVKISNKNEGSFGVILTNYLHHIVHFPYTRVPTDAQVYILYVYRMKRKHSFLPKCVHWTQEKQVRKLGLAGPTQTTLQKWRKQETKTLEWHFTVTWYVCHIIIFGSILLYYKVRFAWTNVRTVGINKHEGHTLFQKQGFIVLLPCLGFSLSVDKNKVKF